MSPIAAAQIASEATFLPLQSKAGKENALAEFLRKAADTVGTSEPATLQWLALREDGPFFAVMDFFVDARGRAAHFSGQVAADLRRSAPDLVEGGWDQGVAAMVENGQVLSSMIRAGDSREARIANRITFQAKPGKQDQVADLLRGAGEVVRDTEPDTLLWFSIRTDPRSYALFGVFEGEAGRKAHFAGKVAAALREKADQLIEGGWGSGVAANRVGYEVIASVY